MRSADGIERNSDVYIIPKFELMDNDGKKLLIKNLYCNITKTRFDNIDVLLSGNVFYNASLTITPNIKDNITRRLIRIDTFEDKRNILIMEPVKNLEGRIVAYPTYMKNI
ncbi:MAG: hypothetical protein IJ733_11360 [Lachnospiraceae bacterium]|nr:hypothetical protein [Lachnospiraceae bacterium]